MISIIIPYTRFDGFKRCVEAVYKNAEVFFEIVSEYDFKQVGCNPMVNLLVRRSRYDIVCFLHDDSIPQPRFLRNAYREMLKFPDGWGCIGFNDLIHGEDGPPTHWMIHKKMLKCFPDGVFYSEDYKHTCVDMELKMISELAGRYKWVEDAAVKHKNPIHCSDVKRDSLHRECYSHAKRDRELFDKRWGGEARKAKV